MALPAGMIVALGELAMSPKVQEFATKLVKDVYGKIMPSGESEKSTSPVDPKPVTLESLSAKIEDLPTKQEIIASFAVLQAELEREHRTTQKWLRFVLALQLVWLVAVAGLLTAG